MLPSTSLPRWLGLDDGRGPFLSRPYRLASDDPRLLAFLLDRRDTARFVVAAPNTQLLAPIIVRTGQAAMAFGGVALSLLHGTTVTADVRRAGAGVVTGPRSSIGVGIQSKILSFLPLRGGLARVDGGWQAAAGVGVHVFAFELAISGATRQLASGSATGVMLGLVSVGR